MGPERVTKGGRVISNVTIAQGATVRLPCSINNIEQDGVSSDISTIYCASKKSCPIFIVNSQYQNEQNFFEKYKVNVWKHYPVAYDFV